MSRTETYRFNVVTNMSGEFAARIEAAYFVHEDDFTVFKAVDGGVVASFANRHLVSVEREVTSVSGPRHTALCIDGSKCGGPHCPGW